VVQHRRVVQKSITTLADSQNWYWGENRGTASPVAIAPLLNWLVAGIHGAGPHLTPKTFQQGFFSTPASGGAATGNPLVPLTAYGRQTGLPYPLTCTAEPTSSHSGTTPPTGPASVTGIEAKGMAWYPNQGKRYKRDTIAKLSFGYFDTSNSIVAFDTRPPTAAAPVYAGTAQPARPRPAPRSQARRATTASSRVRTAREASACERGARAGVKIAAGEVRWMADYEFPVTLGRDFAGVVEQTGRAVRRPARLVARRRRQRTRTLQLQRDGKTQPREGPVRRCAARHGQAARVHIQRRYPLAAVGDALRAPATSHTQGKLGIVVV
jgi:hypothetical protein